MTVKAKPKYSKETFPSETLFNTKHIITLATKPILCMVEKAFSFYFMKIHYMWSFLPKNMKTSRVIGYKHIKRPTIMRQTQEPCAFHKFFTVLKNLLHHQYSKMKIQN
jgi:hypothetical protein